MCLVTFHDPARFRLLKIVDVNAVSQALLTEVVIANSRPWIVKTGEARESFTLDYRKVELPYTNGSAGGNIVVLWDYSSGRLLSAQSRFHAA
jgi:hypothetical protein